ncbi:dnaJ homolog subfamily C member 28 [Cephus cinctus]|uniref:DnaJ homolog subfamily C member 28 n=1 Tax=Cephus cinctus TaxID=211228 RepID=A0AAJ7W273_CEPCN|nr:dnaJ homolog subfamily C member 28 [Cephus cinctus]
MLSCNYIRIQCAKHFGSKRCFENRCYVATRHQHQNASKRSYEILGVSEDCEDETLRLAFVHLAKKFHPDGRSSEADPVRFTEIEKAYRDIQRSRSEQRERESKIQPQIDEHDIKHTAPQHRRYLNYDVGIGTPSKRQRQYSIERAQKAVDNIMEHRLKKLQAEERNTLMGMDKERAKDIKTRYGMDRLVEDLIQEAMNKGEFSDLPGSGKPLKNFRTTENPYVDFVTHKLNQVLIDNGFTPEWIQLSKEIREEKDDLQKRLIEARNRLGTTPLSEEDLESWQNTLESLKIVTKKINDKVDKYNLLVPILQKQMLQVNLDALAEEALTKPVVPVEKRMSKNCMTNRNQDHGDIFSALLSFLDRKHT